MRPRPKFGLVGHCFEHPRKLRMDCGHVRTVGFIGADAFNSRPFAVIFRVLRHCKPPPSARTRSPQPPNRYNTSAVKRFITGTFKPPIKFALNQSWVVVLDMTKEPIVAICLVNRHELESLGPSFDRAYPVQNTPCFGELLRTIDEADGDGLQVNDLISSTSTGRTTS